MAGRACGVQGTAGRGQIETGLEITSKGITLEEYLNRLPKGDVAPPPEK